MNKYRSGVLYGKELEALYNDAKANNFAIPAVNTTGTDTSMQQLKQQLK
jgi:fructose-bisphosphate aldolase class II